MVQKGSTWILSCDNECECVVCGTIFLAKNKTNKYCSNRCKRIYLGVIPNQTYIKHCGICGSEFITNKSQKKYCSSKCKEKGSRKTPEAQREKYIREHPNYKSMNQRMFEAEEKRNIKSQQYNDYLLQCQENRNKKYEESHPLIKCQICGDEFRKGKRTKYCSDDCGKKASRKNQIKTKKRYKGITVDSDITLLKLAERDHNQCKLCGLDVNWNDKEKIKGTTIVGSMYPSIDHITPISLGGLHSWNNIQLAHCKCNTLKSNKYIG